MLLIPAIDIKDGHCVRLRQGDLTSNITVFNTDPVAQARHWVELGAERLQRFFQDGTALQKRCRERQPR